MPEYHYKCRSCGNRFSLFYKTYAEFDAAKPVCPNCGRETLSALIQGVQIAAPNRDYTKMSSQEMLSVLESGDSRQVGEMFQQVGGTDPRLGKQYHDATQKLLKGEKIEKVERDLRHNSDAE
ncbi:MAG: hypothetical protein CUN56_03365 [Phototrophicales bacterium]|nr:MAG: hypothetical protein CUN56_03365 [Phototrophicales bacterium]RMG77720.1 MAG: zinc ribbon domain-containing protein [Chloroflexota bacterium]